MRQNTWEGPKVLETVLGCTSGAPVGSLINVTNTYTTTNRPIVKAIDFEYLKF